LRLEPSTPKELCDALAWAASAKHAVELGGRFSKRTMGGPPAPAEITITTTGLDRILQYEPTDLTLSVEAGISWEKLCRVLAANNQMIPLDPPLPDLATVGGVIATNGSGPRRRLYGTARDLVIGMKFATLEGKEVQSGGMVVKNVAGLDMGKLMIGSFGTLAAISTVNFKLTPKPESEKTSLLDFDTLDAAIAARDRLTGGVLQPEAVDLFNPRVASTMGIDGFVLAVQFGGNAAVVARCARELGGTLIEDGPQDDFWNAVVAYPRRFLSNFTQGAVVRIASTLAELRAVFSSLEVPAIARAANGVAYAYFASCEAAAAWLLAAKDKPWKCVVEYSPENAPDSLELWPSPGDDFEMMKRIKHMFDPGNLLNHGRLYRRI